MRRLFATISVLLMLVACAGCQSLKTGKSGGAKGTKSDLVPPAPPGYPKAKGKSAHDPFLPAVSEADEETLGGSKKGAVATRAGD